MSTGSRRNPYWQWYQQHKTLVWGSAAAATALYVAYRATREDGEGEKDGAQPSTAGPGPGSAAMHRGESLRRAESLRRPGGSQFSRLRSVISNYSTAASTLSETLAQVSTDLQDFLTSDATELPQSLRQLNKLLQAPELQETVATTAASVVRGVSSAAGVGGSQDTAATLSSLTETVLEAVLSERGRGLVGMAVGVATRNATNAVCEFMERRIEAAASSGAASAAGFGLKDILDLLASDQGERLLTLLLTKSIRTAVCAYVDATTGMNMYEDMLASISKQEHRDAVTEIMSRVSASFCRELAMSYRRATAANANASMCSAGSNSGTPGANAKFAAAAAAAAAAAGTAGSPGGVVAPATPGASSASSSTGGATVALVCTAAGGADAHGADALACSGGSGKGGQGRLSFGSSKGHYSMSGANTGAGLGRTLTVQAPPVWLKQVVELARERDVRALAVDVVCGASREATRGAVEGLLQGSGLMTSGGSGSGSGALLLPPGLVGAKLYVLASLAVSMCMYALSPRVMML